MAVVVVSCLISARPPQSTTAKRYLEWLRASVDSLIAAVNSGERQQPADVTLAVAVAGLSAVSMSPVVADLAAAYDVATAPREVL